MDRQVKMNYTACSVIYVNKTAKHDELVRQDMDISVLLESLTPLSLYTSPCRPSQNTELLRHNIKKLMRVFNEGILQNPLSLAIFYY